MQSLEVESQPLVRRPSSGRGFIPDDVLRSYPLLTGAHL